MHAAAHAGSIYPFDYVYPMLRYPDNANNVNIESCLSGSGEEACGEEGVAERIRLAADLTTTADRTY
jgi:hypothetical protein